MGRKRRGAKPAKAGPVAVSVVPRGAPSRQNSPAARILASSRAIRTSTGATATAAIFQRYAEDDRASLALLLAPFMIVAAMLAGQQALRIDIDSTDLPVAMPAPAPPVVGAPLGPFPNVTAEGYAEPSRRSSLAAKRVLVKRPSLPPLSALARPGEVIAMLPTPLPANLPPPPAAPSTDAPPALCLPMPDLDTRARIRLQAAFANGIGPDTFGRALAEAARAQLDDVVVYNARYTRLKFPNGDVPSLFGVCTDVVIRAYRALGIDLQALVQATRTGRGDANIDHRRVEVLRKFFEKHGEALTITDIADDYRPGDIVTYYRPQNRTSTAHIAIVTDLRAPSGRPYILHNRGWGAQLEDALFVDKITGHYRYTGRTMETPAAETAPVKSRRPGVKTAAAGHGSPGQPKP